MGMGYESRNSSFIKSSQKFHKFVAGKHLWDLCPQPHRKTAHDCFQAHAGKSGAVRDGDVLSELINE